MAYLRNFFILFLGLLAVIAAATLGVDPFAVTGMPLLRGFNDQKSAGNDRFYKPLQVSARRPDIVFLGSSRVEVALDPADLVGRRAYNLAVPGVTIVEEAALARHAMSDTPVRQIVLGLDFASFDDAGSPAAATRIEDLGPHLLMRSLPLLLVSEQALLRARATLSLSWRGKQSVNRPDGFILFPRDAMRDPVQAVLGDVPTYLGIYRGFGRVERSLAAVEALLATARAQGVAVTAFVPPSHAALMEAMHAAGTAPAYATWLGDLAAICARQGVPLWDFAGHNRITTVALADSFMTFFDGSHVQPWVGRLMLEAMLEGRGGPSFGTLLTPAALDVHLADQANHRAAWQRREPADRRVIDKLVGSGQ
jgi:hypothetical protein